jgi:hypothetical protein
MNALPQFQDPQRQDPQRLPSRQPLRRPVTQTKSNPAARQHRLTAIETSVRLGVNVGLSAIALSTLVYLLPYRTAQVQKLKEVQTEVSQAEMRVAQLQAEFGRSFDSNQVKAILQEQTHMVDPSQRVIVFDDRIPMDGEKNGKVAQMP